MKDLDFSLNKNLFDAALMPDFRTATRDSYANLRTMEDLDTDLYLDVNGEFYSGTFTLRDCPFATPVLRIIPIICLTRAAWTS